MEKSNDGAIVIKADNKSNKILAELAKKLSGSVMNLKDEQFGDFMLGSLMDPIMEKITVK